MVTKRICTVACRDGRRRAAPGRRIAALILLVVSVSPAAGALLGGEGDGAADRSPSRYLGVVKRNRVRLRTGGSLNHHDFALLGEGQGVVVEEERRQWCKVLVPRWIPLYVHGKFVEARTAAGRDTETPRRGTVSADRLVVRVVPERRHEAVGILARGSRVEILGAEGEWWKIAPPPGTHGWVHSDLVARHQDLSRQEALAIWKRLGTEAGSAVDSGILGPEVVRPGTPDREARESAAGATTLAAAWRELKRVLGEEDEEKRDFGPVRASFRNVLERSRSPAEVRQAREGLRLLKWIEQRKDRIQTVDELINKARARELELQRQLQEIKQSRTRVREDKVQTGDSDPFVARGWVAGMDRKNGRPAAHRLVDSRGRLLYLLQCKEGHDIKLDSHVGKRVGIRGVKENRRPGDDADLISVSAVVQVRDESTRRNGRD